ncbi:PH domain-containing protein [Saccharopolyspora rosea]
MGNGADGQPSGPAEWATPIGLVVFGWLLAAASVAWWVAATGPTDHLFIGVFAVAVIAASTFASACRPRLRADDEGITVRGLRGSRHWPWRAVAVRVQHSRRFGREVAMLELDADVAGFVVLGRFDLGADPHDVAAVLDALRREPPARN